MEGGGVSAAFRERLVHDAERGELRDGEARYLLIREDSLMGMFRRLPDAARSEALAAFAASIAEHGRRSAESYRSGSDADALLRTIEQTAPQLGWGRWRFEHGDADRLELEVANSPFAHGYGAAPQPVCAAIAGMLRAVASLAFGAPATAEERRCAATGHPACRFVARRERR